MLYIFFDIECQTISVLMLFVYKYFWLNDSRMHDVHLLCFIWLKQTRNRILLNASSFVNVSVNWCKIVGCSSMQLWSWSSFVLLLLPPSLLHVSLYWFILFSLVAWYPFSRCKSCKTLVLVHHRYQKVGNFELLMSLTVPCLKMPL